MVTRHFAPAAAGICAVFVLSSPAPAQNAPLQTTFPASTAAPHLFADTPPPKNSRYYYGDGERFLVPISRVRQDASGSSDATAAVNYLTCASPLPSGAAPADLWLGTQGGIKHLSGGAFHYYLKESGLPGEYVEAVSAGETSSDVFALVRVPRTEQSSGSNRDRDRLAFCVWNKGADTWQAAETINSVLPERGFSSFPADPERAAQRDLQAQAGKGVLTQSASFACFAPAIVSRDDAALAYLWDKKTRKVQPVPWEAAFKENAPAYVGVSFLWMDEPQQTLWMGTSQGLLAYNLSSKTWRTVLSGQIVSAGAVAPDKSALYIATRLPLPAPVLRTDPISVVPAKPPAASDTPPLWRLVRVDVPSGEAIELPPPPRSVTDEGYFYTSRQPTRRVDNLWTDGKTVWVTQAGFSAPGYYGGGNEKGGIERFDIAQKTWESIALMAQPLVTFTKNAPPVPQTPPNFALVQARLDTVPDAALLPLTLSLDNGEPQYGDYAPFERAYNASYWITHRFPAWYGVIDIEAQAAASTPYRANVATGGNRTWFLQGDTLLSNPASAKNAQSPSPEAQAYPLRAVFSGFRPPVTQIVSASQQNPALLLVQSIQSLFLVNAQTGSWQPLKRIVRGQNMLSSYNGKLAPGALGRVLVQSGYSNQPLLQWSSATKGISDAQVSGPPNSKLFGPGQNGGAWFTLSDGKDTPVYQAAPSSQGRPVPVTLSARPPRPRGPPFALGQTITHRARLRHGAAKSGTNCRFAPIILASRTSMGNPVRASATHLPPTIVSLKHGQNRFPLPQGSNSQPPVLLHTANATYAATVAGNLNGSVWKWSDASAKWQIIAPSLPPETGLFEYEEYPRQRPVLPVSVDEKAVWVMVQGRMMARYSFSDKKWQTVALPPELTEPARNYYQSDKRPQVAQVGPNEFCIGSGAGLWRVHIGQNKNGLTGAWKPITRQVSIASRPLDKNNAVSPGNAQQEFNLSGVTVTPKYVWVTGKHQTEAFSFAARLDKVSGTWTTWDVESGFPIQDEYLSAVTPENDTIWLQGRSGTYRYEPKTKHWQLIVRSSDNSRIAENAVVYKAKGQSLSGSVRDIAEDANAVYVLLNALASPSEVPQKAGDKTLLLRWDKAAQSIAALPFPSDFSPTYVQGTALFSEPGTVWVGTSTDLWAWNKAARTWSRPAYPAALPFYAPSRIVRDGNALVLTPGYGYQNRVHVVRLVGPEFSLKPEQTPPP